MRKKILFMIHDLGQGGAEKVLVNLVNNMDQDKFDITVMALFGGGVNEQFLRKEINYKTVFSKTFPGNSHLMKLFSPKCLHGFFIKEKYDVEISYLEGTCARIVSGCMNEKTKLFSWIHVEQHTRKCATKAFRSFKESVKCYSQYTNILCVSKAVKSCFSKLYPMCENVSVVYNTIDADKIIRLKDEVVEAGIFEKEEIRLCAMGKLMPSKRFDKLAEVHKSLINEGYPIHTYILGDGPERKKIKAYLSEYGLEENFTFLGYQINPYKYIAKCDLFVCTSMAEGFSTAVTEALILGIPVITTPVAGMKELLGSHNEYGIVVDNSDEAIYQNIKYLLDNSFLLDEYKLKAQEYSKIFCVEVSVKEVEKMIIKELNEK